MHTADDDSVPVPTDALYLPRPVLMRAAVWRPQRDELEPEDTDVTSVDALSAPTSSRTASDDFDDEPTRAIQTSTPPPPLPRKQELPQTPERPDALPVLLARGTARFDDLLARGTAHLDTALAHAAQLWRDGPLRTAAMVAGAALITYLAVGGARRGAEQGAQMVLVPAAALPAAAPIIVEQLNEARQPLETGAAPLRGEQSNRPARSSSSSRTRMTSTVTTPTSKSLGYQVIAPAQAKPKSSRAERSSTAASSSSSGLPAWGAEAVRDFSGGKSSAGASVSSHSQAPTAKPTSSNPDIPPPMAGDRSSAREQPVEARGFGREENQAAPVVAAKPAAPVVAAEPPKPVEPPPPKKPLTMDQVLNQVEEAAQAQRKKEGLKAPKASKADAELDALISGAMKSKAK